MGQTFKLACFFDYCLLRVHSAQSASLVAALLDLKEQLPVKFSFALIERKQNEEVS